MSFISAIFIDEVHLHVTASEPVEKELKYLFSLDPPQATSKKNKEFVFRFCTPSRQSSLHSVSMKLSTPPMLSGIDVL